VVPDRKTSVKSLLIFVKHICTLKTGGSLW
jgi:hypothetical protein